MLAISSLWMYPTPAQAQVTIHEPHEVQEIKSDEAPQNKLVTTSITKPKTVSVDAIHNNQSVQQPTRKYSGWNYSKEEVQQLIRDYSAKYGIDSAAPLCIAKAESGWNQFSKNASSSASGVFQYLSSTWKSTDEGKLGLSVFDAEANVKAAVKYMAIHKNTKPWVVAKNCPSLISQQ